MCIDPGEGQYSCRVYSQVTRLSSPCPSSPSLFNAAGSVQLVNSVASNAATGPEREQQQRKPLPSLCAEIEEPEPHPDYEQIMASYRHRGQSLPLDHCIYSEPHRRASLPDSIQFHPSVAPREKPATEPQRRVHDGSSICEGERRSHQRLPHFSLRLPMLIASQSRLQSSNTSISSSPPVRSTPPPASRRKSSAVAHPARKSSTSFDFSPSRPATVYATADYNVTATRYVTDADPRGFLPGE
jgi:hypothetical protein